MKEQIKILSRKITRPGKGGKNGIKCRTQKKKTSKQKKLQNRRGLNDLFQDSKRLSGEGKYCTQASRF